MGKRVKKDVSAVCIANLGAEACVLFLNESLLRFFLFLSHFFVVVCVYVCLCR